MSHLEMRNFVNQYSPDDAEVSAQDRLLYNNNYNSHLLNHHVGEVSENHYQLPYAHLHQSPYLHRQQIIQQQQGSYSSDDRSGSYTSRNFNGSNHHYPQGSLHEKYGVGYPPREDTPSRRSNRTSGSGIVYRPRRRLYWIIALSALLLLILTGAVVIVLYFTVFRQAKDATSSSSGPAYNKSNTALKTEMEAPTRQPPYYVPVSETPSPNQPFWSRVSDPVFVKIQKFDAYWHPGDSRLFVATLTNGTVIQVFGTKKSDGTVKSLYSLSVTDADDATTSLRFLGQRNLASVILPSGVIVTYDWSANNIDMEVKIFEPFTDRTRGPISHLALVEVGVRSYLLRQISKVMEDQRSKKSNQVSGSQHDNSRCMSRFPVKVTKCGGQYPYDGAFVQGVITGMDKPITMTALPWPKESDPCFDVDNGVISNYYLPIPAQLDEENATMIKKTYADSSARLFTELCNIISDQVFLEHHNLCSDIANKVRKKLGRHHLLGVVLDSCSAVLNVLHTSCVAISGIASVDNMPSLTEYGLLRSFTRRLSDSFQPDLPDLVDLKTMAFCPSSLPISSFQSTVDIRTTRDSIVNDVIHINCPDYPEVTYVDLDHLLTRSDAQTSSTQFDQVKHKMRICSICAFEKTVRAQIVSDEMLCNNTCTKTNVLENIPDRYTTETKGFLEEDSVYCHDFLTTVDNSMYPIGRQCLGNCMSHLHVKFQIKNSDSLFYDQTVQCSELRSHACRMKFGK